MRFLLSLLMIGLASWQSHAADRFQTSAGPVTVERIVEKLNRPWAVAFLPDGGLLITERDVGILKHVAPDGSISEVSNVPEISRDGQGGLLDLVLARDFGTTRELFLSYSEPEGFEQRTALAVARLSDDNSTLENVRVIFRINSLSSSGSHFGGRIVEDTTGALFMTVGDRARSSLAQDPKMHNGKVIRVNRDGSIPADNPFRTGPILPEIWSMGHRNAQGAALDEKGRLWTVSHGAAGGDEVNQPRPARNYGWPVISYGRHYSGGQIGIGTSAPGMEQPKHYWDPSIAPSGMMIYSGKLFPAWKGDIFVGSLKFDHISRLERDDETITGEEQLFRDAYERIRDVREGPDGAIWFLSVGDRALYRVTPAE
ncbi:PQQ-dependent sugar dehydrogenase [Minwuia sp.]|uniref:PQQ-dependent sugar dehydrogenase n=1 Tax=Minwuia sp. TaxID=2493630 RepID=UPI003A901206